MFNLIVALVCIISAMVATVAAVYARVNGRKASLSAKEATERSAAYSAMVASWNKAANDALVLDVAIKDAQVNLGLRTVQGTVLGYPAVKR